MICKRFATTRDGPLDAPPDVAPPSGRAGRLRFAAILITLALAAVGCGEPAVSQYNYPPSLTSIGPVTFDGNSVLVDYSIRDREGDDQSIFVGVCAGSNDTEGICASPVQGAGGDGQSYLPTAPKGTNVAHTFSWNVGCGRVAGGKCVETKLDEPYRFRIRLQGTDDSASSERFTLQEEFGLDSIPACDTSAGRIPEPCDPAQGANP